MNSQNAGSVSHGNLLQTQIFKLKSQSLLICNLLTSFSGDSDRVRLENYNQERKEPINPEEYIAQRS